MATHPQYPCLEIPTDRGAWQAAVHRAFESDMTEHTHIQWRIWGNGENTANLHFTKSY